MEKTPFINPAWIIAGNRDDSLTASDGNQTETAG